MTNQFITIYELQKMTQLCRNTLILLANRGEFNIYKLGKRRIAFNLNEIENWLNRCKVKPISTEKK